MLVSSYLWPVEKGRRLFKYKSRLNNCRLLIPSYNLHSNLVTLLPNAQIMLFRSHHVPAVILLVARALAANQTCKTTPFDAAWPSMEQWSAFNTSIGGTLIKANPVASSCYINSTFSSGVACDVVKADWTLPTFHAALPESIDYPLFANSSCLPPGVPGFTEQRGCTVGGLPQYIVSATSEEQIAATMVWATSHNIRIVIKGTGHDMNGR